MTPDPAPVPTQRRIVCSKACAIPTRDPTQEHPGICVCGGYLTDEVVPPDGTAAALKALVERMRSDRARFQSHPGGADVVWATDVDNWADELEAALAALPEARLRYGVALAVEAEHGTNQTIMGGIDRDDHDSISSPVRAHEHERLQQRADHEADGQCRLQDDGVVVEQGEGGRSREVSDLRAQSPTTEGNCHLTVALPEARRQEAPDDHREGNRKSAASRVAALDGLPPTVAEARRQEDEK